MHTDGQKYHDAVSALFALFREHDDITIQSGIEPGCSCMCCHTTQITTENLDGTTTILFYGGEDELIEELSEWYRR